MIHYPIIAFICLCLQLFPTLMHKRDGDLVARAKAIFDQEAANLHGMPIVSCPSEIQYIVLETIGLRMISELADEADRLRKKIALKNTLQGITTFLILSSTMAYIALFVCDNFTQLYLPDAQKISSSPQGFAPAYGYRMMDTGAVARPSNQGAVTP